MRKMIWLNKGINITVVHMTYSSFTYCFQVALSRLHIKYFSIISSKPLFKTTKPYRIYNILELFIQMLTTQNVKKEKIIEEFNTL